MNTSTLDFTSRLDPEETEYTSISLRYLKNSILNALDIVEVARKLGIDLQELPQNSEEQENYSTSDIYVGDCPRCSEKWKLRVFTQYQTFWCLSCHWEWEYTDNMKIFHLLTHHDESYFDGFWMNPESDKKKIMRLFELFPEELAFLQWKNLNRYEYSGDYLSAAEGYYPWIEQDLEKAWTYKHQLEKRHKLFRENKNLENNTILLRESSKKIYRLERIIAGYAITSQIYSRREEVNKIVHTQSTFKSSVPDEFLETREWYSEMPHNATDVEYDPWEIDTYWNVGIHFKTPTREYRYIEIPDATFHSHITRPEYSNEQGDPAVWNYIIAYSKEENNFSIFLSPQYKIKELREQEYRNRFYRLSPGEGSFVPAITIENIVNDVERDPVYGNRFSFSSGEENTPILPDGYYEVATGGWIYTNIGMFFNSGKNEFLTEGECYKTPFDTNLFHNCMQDIRATFPIFTDKKEFIFRYNLKIWNPRKDEAARRRFA